jgi:hypothetical protein
MTDSNDDSFQLFDLADVENRRKDYASALKKIGRSHRRIAE